tara:strand:- start:357 stop:1199 length:843 start_codon:yes stop_codon:yes gene_type:complete
MQISQLLNQASKYLKNKNILSHRIDSEILLSKVLHKSREELIINFGQHIEKEKISKFKGLIHRRSLNEPVAYIIKKREFWSRNFIVDRNTLIPRPETELMVEKIVDIFKMKNISILDIGTGSGCILLSILNELEHSEGIGIDISKKAIDVANKNLKSHKFFNKIKFLRKSLDQIHNKKFDLVVSNPPYITKNDIRNLNDDIKKFEPKLALDGGNDGLDVIKKVIYKSKSILKFNGMLALEIGNGQFKKVSKILEINKFRTRYLIKDYQENVRCILSILTM